MREISGWYESEDGAVMVTIEADTIEGIIDIICEDFPEIVDVDFEFTNEDGFDVTANIHEALIGKQMSMEVYDKLIEDYKYLTEYLTENRPAFTNIGPDIFHKGKAVDMTDHQRSEIRATARYWFDTKNDRLIRQLFE